MKKTAKDLYEEAFAIPRDPRSEEYRAGALEALKFRMGELGRMRCPYKGGTSQADAWISGTDEGHQRGRDYLGSWMPQSGQ